MAGIVVFQSVADAWRQGFSIYDKSDDGYVVRRKIGEQAWEMALVVLKSG